MIGVQPDTAAHMQSLQAVTNLGLVSAPKIRPIVKDCLKVLPKQSLSDNIGSTGSTINQIPATPSTNRTHVETR
jgi:hypothetical protein